MKEEKQTLVQLT